MEGLRDEADRAKRECLGVKKIAEEKEILFKQEQAALRKVRHTLRAFTFLDAYRSSKNCSGNFGRKLKLSNSDWKISRGKSFEGAQHLWSVRWFNGKCTSLILSGFFFFAAFVSTLALAIGLHSTTKTLKVDAFYISILCHRKSHDLS